MNSSALVSVVIPCYNQAHYLWEAIESVRRQTYPHVDTIVVDDGSQDNTAEVARQYDVRYIYQANSGVAAARNTGVAHASGEYVIFLDADDRLLPGAIEVGVQRLAARPECAFAAGQCRYIGSDGSALPTPPQVAVQRDHYLQLLRGNYIFTPANVIYRRSTIDAVGGFNPTVNPAADYDMYLRIALRFRIHCHSAVVAEYRRHSGSMSCDVPRMCDAVLRVHRFQQKHVGGNQEREAAYDGGRWFWEEMYREELLKQLRWQVRYHQYWSSAAYTTYGLARYYLPRLAMRGARKLFRTISRPFVSRAFATTADRGYPADGTR